MPDIDPAELDRLTVLVAEQVQQIEDLKYKLQEASRCSSCADPLSKFCSRCQKAWES